MEEEDGDKKRRDLKGSKSQKMRFLKGLMSPPVTHGFLGLLLRKWVRVETGRGIWVSCPHPRTPFLKLTNLSLSAP